MKSVNKMLLLVLSLAIALPSCPTALAIDAESFAAQNRIQIESETAEETQGENLLSLLSESPSLPQIKRTVYDDDFSGRLNSRIVKKSGSGESSISGGNLVITRPDTARVNVPDETRIYLNEAKTADETAQIAIEFVINRDALKLLDIGFFDAEDNRISAIKFLKSGEVAYSYKKNQSDMAAFHIEGGEVQANEDVKVTAEINHVAKTISVWIDETAVIYQETCENACDNLAYINFLMRTSSYQTVQLKSIKIYESRASDADRVNMDYALLTFDKLSTELKEAVTANLTLPKTGDRGSTISWATTDENVITTDGKVTRPTDADKFVTLTATIGYGDEAKTKTFDITVKKLIVTDMPAVKTVIVEDSMTNTKFSSLYAPEAGSPKATENGIKMAAGDAFEYFHDTVRSDYYTPLAYEFTLSGTGTKISLYDANDTACFSIKQETDGVYALIRKEYGVPPEWTKLKDGYLSAAKIVIIADPASGMFSLWYGDDKLVEAAYGADIVSRLYRINFVQTGELAFIRDFKAYVANVPSAIAAKFDFETVKLANITWQDADSITDNLKLQTLGNAGSLISWASSDEAVISKDGTVAIPETDTPVTLTATVTNGENVYSKDIPVTVIATKKSEKPEVKKMLITDGLDENKQSGNWTFDQTNGAIYVKEGKVVMKRLTYSEEVTGTTNTYVYPGGGAYLSGVYCMEFTMRKIGDPYGVNLRATGKGGDYFALNWYADNTMKVYCGESQAQIYADDEKTTKFADDAAKITILFNTLDSTYSMWVNDKLKIYNQPSRETNKNIRVLRFYAEKSTKPCIEIDNFVFYEAYSLSTDRVPLDYDNLVVNKLIDSDDAAVSFGYLSENLTLPTYGEYGSNISWASSDESVISTTGVVTKADEYKTVTLTATISSGDTSLNKEFTFVVIPNISDGAAAAEKDLALLTYEVLACDEAGSKEIKRSLNFVGKGAFGSEILWETSDSYYITAAGRVNRPYAGKEDVPITVKATVKNGDAEFTKQFEFVVLADEEFVDPGFMSDEEFFGVWDGSKWTVEGKWNYSYSGMESVGEAVKEAGESGDYKKAKEALLSYFKNDRKSYSTIKNSDRNTGWANMASDLFYHLQQSKYYQGSGYAKSDWETVYVNLTRKDELTPGNNISYSIRAWYNESSMAEIARHNASDKALRPKLELTVNGVQKVIEAMDSVEIRAGSYSGTNFNNEEIMKVQTFGDFLSDDTRYAQIKFNLGELKETDVVSKARLVLHTRTPDNSEKEKRFIVIFEPSSTWSGESVVWDDFTGYVYNFNGLPDKINWNRLPDADGEVYAQASRFYALPVMALEYQLSGDSSYAYKAQRILEDFLTDKGNFRSSSTNGGADPNGIRGGFSTSLATTLRMGTWQKSLDILMKNPHATPDFATAFLKSMWDSYNFLATYQTASGNWRQYEFEGLLEGAMKMPEFTDSTDGTDWEKIASGELSDLIFLNNTSDGSYVEACNDYSISAFGNFVEYKATVIESGGQVSAEYDELLHKMAYYQAMLYTSDGTGLSYGDGGDSKRPADSFQKVVDWYGDDVLEYIITYGKRGTEPEWTSIHFPDSTVTAMHANWSTSAPYLFVHVRGGGNHGHSDDNGIILSAYNRLLLVDAGKFAYDSTDPYRQYGASTEAHNTLWINEGNQRHKTGVLNFTHEYSEVHEFTTNRAFDYLSQSTTSRSGFNHTRTITFLKPNVWVVSDKAVPTDSTKTNNYKQLWHMPATSGLATSEDNRTIYSNFETGANIILASADSDAQVKEALGWIDNGYAVAQPSTYGYYEKTNVKGTVTMDTVIAVNDEDETAALTSEKLETEGDATAVKFDVTANGEDYVCYYRMSYDHSTGSFGSYETDAKLAYVQEKADGTINAILVKDGSYIKKADGTVIFESEETVGEVYVDMSGTNTYITTDENTDCSKFTFHCEKQPLELYINNTVEDYSYSEGYITNIGSPSDSGQTAGKIPSAGITQDKKEEEEDVKTDTENKTEEKDDKDKDDDSDNEKSGGGGSGGGSAGGGASGGGGAVSVVFPDTVGHWAREYILDLKTKNIVNGDENGNFNPNNKITRAEFIAIVTRAMGLGNPEYSGAFSDVASDSWYAKAVQAGLDAGLISKDTVFRPNDSITRQEMAKIIAEAAKLPEKYASAEGQLEKYKDKESISDWAKSYVGLISLSGLMSGRDDGGFYPLDNSTRAEAATVISRMIKKS